MSPAKSIALHFNLPSVPTMARQSTCCPDLSNALLKRSADTMVADEEGKTFRGAGRSQQVVFW